MFEEDILEENPGLSEGDVEIVTTGSGDDMRFEARVTESARRRELKESVLENNPELREGDLKIVTTEANGEEQFEVRLTESARRREARENATQQFLNTNDLGATREDISDVSITDGQVQFEFTRAFRREVAVERAAERSDGRFGEEDFVASFEDGELSVSLSSEGRRQVQMAGSNVVDAEVAPTRQGPQGTTVPTDPNDAVTMPRDGTIEETFQESGWTKQFVSTGMSAAESVKRNLRTRVEQNTGLDAGEDFTVQRTDDGFRTTLTESGQRELARESAQRQVAARTGLDEDEVGVELERRSAVEQITGLKRSRQSTVAEGNVGSFDVSLDQYTTQRVIREQVKEQSDLEDDEFLVIRDDSTDTYSIQRTDEGEEEFGNFELAIPGTDTTVEEVNDRLIVGYQETTGAALATAGEAVGDAFEASIRANPGYEIREGQEGRAGELGRAAGRDVASLGNVFRYAKVADETLETSAYGGRRIRQGRGGEFASNLGDAAVERGELFVADAKANPGETTAGFVATSLAAGSLIRYAGRASPTAARGVNAVIDPGEFVVRGVGREAVRLGRTSRGPRPSPRSLASSERGQLQSRGESEVESESEVSQDTGGTIEIADTSPSPGKLPGSETAGKQSPGGEAESGGDPWPDYMLPEGHPLRSDNDKTPVSDTEPETAVDQETATGSELEPESADITGSAVIESQPLRLEAEFGEEQQQRQAQATETDVTSPTSVRGRLMARTQQDVVSETRARQDAAQETQVSLEDALESDLAMENALEGALDSELESEAQVESQLESVLEFEQEAEAEAEAETVAELEALSDVSVKAEFEQEYEQEFESEFESEYESETETRPRFDLEFDPSGGEGRGDRGRDPLGSVDEPGDDGLAAGWLSETFATIATQGRRTTGAPSQDVLEDQPRSRQLTGELPTALELDGSQDTQDAIDDVESFFSFGTQGGGSR